MPPPDALAAFKAAFKQAVKRDVTDAELADVGFLSTLATGLLEKLPVSALRQLPLDRLAFFSNPFLLANLPEIIPRFPNERLVGIPYRGSFGDIGTDANGKPLKFGFAVTDLDRLISDPGRRSELGGQAGYEGLLQPRVSSEPSPEQPPLPPPAPEGGTTVPPPLSVPQAPRGIAIPAATHGWVTEVGAQTWARNLAASGVPWEEITQERLADDMKVLWELRLVDPRYAKILPYAEQFFATAGRWPTEVELNRFTQKLPDVPNLSPGGETLLPKPKEEPKPGARTKWEVPTDPLPPGYEWRFSADGTPTAFDIDQSERDAFSGWYQNPTTKEWAYNPLLGAADYLQFDPATQQPWSDLLGGFIQRTGRLPNLEEARKLAITLWSQADPAARDRAALYATANGYWPTPFELEFGAAKDTDAQTNLNNSQVPVFVPGIGMVFAPGSSLMGDAITGNVGFVFDPMQGIPGSVRPWIKEILNGNLPGLSLDKSGQLSGDPGASGIPAEMLPWVQFSLMQFQKNAPIKQPTDIPWGTPAPELGGPEVGPKPTPAPKEKEVAAPGAVTPPKVPPPPAAGAPAPGAIAPTGKEPTQPLPTAPAVPTAPTAPAAPILPLPEPGAAGGTIVPGSSTDLLSRGWTIDPKTGALMSPKATPNKKSLGIGPGTFKPILPLPEPAGVP